MVDRRATVVALLELWSRQCAGFQRTSRSSTRNFLVESLLEHRGPPLEAHLTGERPQDPEDFENSPLGDSNRPLEDH